MRRRPRQRAAHRALAETQADRQQLLVIAGGGEARAGKTHQGAAVADPVDQLLARGVGDGADVGHDDHRRLLLEDLRDRLGEVLARRLDEIGEGGKRAGDVIERRKQRLRLVGLGLREEADAAALGVVVEHAHGRRLLFAVDGDRGEVVAQLERHRHLA